MVDLSQLQPIKTDSDEKAEKESSEAVQYLNSTDWYAVRFLETGAEIPKDIKALRASAREKVIK